MAFFKMITLPEEVVAGHSFPRRMESYLKFQADKKGNVQHNNVTGRPILRTRYVTAINADADDFTLSCRKVFAQFGVSRRKNSVQYKHFVQGFPPEDNERMDRETCHQLGVRFAKAVWKDFPVLIVSHFNQENSEEYHWHNHFIVGNCNIHTGQELTISPAAMMGMKRLVAVQAETNGLAQKGLVMVNGQIYSSKQPDRIAAARQELENHIKRQSGRLTPEEIRRHNTLVQIAELRLAILTSVKQTISFDDFCAYLKRNYEIEIRDTYSGISYLHPDRAVNNINHEKGWILGKSLGEAYEKKAIIQAIKDSANNINAEKESSFKRGGEKEKLERLTKLYQELFKEPETLIEDVSDDN